MIPSNFTRRLFGTSDGGDLELLCNPESDLDGSFVAYDVDNRETLIVHGWLFIFEDVDSDDDSRDVALAAQGFSF